jgi:hypothetical protein
MTSPLSGHCLCGAVTFTATPERMEMGICHCAMCRRWTGGAFMAVTCEDVRVADESQFGVYKSSSYGERCFCKACGTTLFWRMADGSHTAVSAQAFDDPSQVPLTSEIFTDEQPANYAFANQTTRMTGPEVIAAFTAKGG